MIYMTPERRQEKMNLLRKLEMRIKALVDNRADLDPHKYETMLDLYFERFLELKKELEE